MTTLVTKKQFASLLNVTTRTIENYCQRRLIPFVQLPGGKRFLADDVQRFVKDRTFNHHQQG